MRRERGLNIGIFHALGDFSGGRKTSINHCRYLQKYQPQHNYLYHDVREPVTDALRAIRFDAILLDVTFLCFRWARPRSEFQEIREKYSFLGEQDAVRLAFPQDEYDHGAILDEWLNQLRVDAVYSVVWDAWDLMFPRTQKHAQMIRALTGYVDDDDVEGLKRHGLAFEARKIDVSYRARDLPPQFGRHGQLKAKLGERFAKAASGSRFKIDVSNHPDDVLLGDEWLKFLGKSKYVLGCEGGSSLWDPHGEIQDRVREYLNEHPGAPYEEVEAACFPGENRTPPFSAISPRMFEVAAARAAQILVPAPYLGKLLAYSHYLPLQPDFSNVAEVLDGMRDAVHAKRMIDACWAELIEPDTYRYSTHAREVMQKILELVEAKGLMERHSASDFAARVEEHLRVAESLKPAIPPPPPILQRVKRRISEMLPSRLKSMLKPFVMSARRAIRRRQR